MSCLVLASRYALFFSLLSVLASRSFVPKSSRSKGGFLRSDAVASLYFTCPLVFLFELYMFCKCWYFRNFWYIMSFFSRRRVPWLTRQLFNAVIELSFYISSVVLSVFSPAIVRGIAKGNCSYDIASSEFSFIVLCFRGRELSRTSERSFSLVRLRFALSSKFCMRYRSYSSLLCIIFRGEKNSAPFRALRVLCTPGSVLSLDGNTSMSFVTRLNGVVWCNASSFPSFNFNVREALFVSRMRPPVLS